MNKVFFGDCRESMRQMISEGVQVQMCVTSPPYFGLRDYGHAGQLGLEATPAEYVAAMVEVFALVRELLAEDGVLWLNLGDSYAANRGYQVPDGKVGDVGNSKGSKVPDGLKPKDLIGIPWRVAFALQEAGWYLRQDIIWAKPNPIPESVTDRCTKSHEYIFLLSKNANYYYDADAIAEPSTEFARAKTGVKFGGNNHCPDTRLQSGKEWTPKMGGGGTSFAGHSGNFRADGSPLTGPTRNKRSVWTVTTKPFKGAHFATFPPALIEPCILAGSKPGDVVLDPFFGSGTTGQVAQHLGRRWIGCELNPNYAPLQNERLAQASFVLEAA